jgi:hypothetical protein
MAQGLPPIPPGGTLIAGGLEGPRGLTFGPDGLLYVAEAGHGGTDPARQDALLSYRQSGHIMVARRPASLVSSQTAAGPR